MTQFEQTIINAFISRYTTYGVDGDTLRIRTVSIFPELEDAEAEVKGPCLDAVESLVSQGLLIPSREKRGEGEPPKTLFCPSIEKIFIAAGRKNRRNEAGEIRTLFKRGIPALQRIRGLSGKGRKGNAGDGKAGGAEFFPSSAIFPPLTYLAENFSPSDFGRGINTKVVKEFLRLLEFLFRAEQWTGVTTRALSVILYGDSKRLEALLDIFVPLFSRLKKKEIPVPDFSFLERSFPEAIISGKFILEYQPAGDFAGTSLINGAGAILYLPLPGIREIMNIKTVDPKERPAVLTVENKETFFVLGDPKSYRGRETFSSAPGSPEFRFDCCLYTGGYPNQAAAALIRILSSCGFSFYHAGDLDPDGILILQNIMDIAEKPVTPVRMDAATFDIYLPWSRILEKTMLSRMKEIRKETMNIPKVAELLVRMEKTRRGIEQEIIDYSG